MFVKLFFKEWKEKLSLFVFPFIGMAIIALVFLAFAEEKSVLYDYLLVGLCYVYLPLMSLLIGASGFQSEFRDDAWAYLFSRPVQKWHIWIIKYLALLSILLTVLLVFFLSIFIIPGFKAPIEIFSLDIEILGSDSFFAHLMFLYLSAFTVTFCLSFIFEKTFIILFASLFLVAGLNYVSYVFFVFLSTFYPFESGIGGFFFFILAAFFAASILTFIKADFTQMKKKVLVFSSFLCAFIVLSLGIKSLWTLNSHYPYAGGFQKYEGGVYFETEKGILRYFPEKDRLETVKRTILLELSPSIRGGKIAFVKYKDRRCLTSELWVMAVDCSQKKLLLERKAERRKIDHSHVGYSHPIESIILSPDGNKIAFIEKTVNAESWKKEFAVSWMNSDGTGLERRPLDFPSLEGAYLLAWPEFEDSLLIILRSQNFDIIKLSLESLTFQPLGEYNIKVKWWRHLRVSPRGDMIAFCTYEEKTGRYTLSILDLKTLEKKEVFAADSVMDIQWSDRGDRLGFVSGETALWVYDLSENRVEKVFELGHKYYYRSRYAFALNGRKLAVHNSVGRTHCLEVFGEDLSKEKSVGIPLNLRDYWHFNMGTGFDNFIFLEAERRRAEVWRIDLNTEEWKKIYPR